MFESDDLAVAKQILMRLRTRPMDDEDLAGLLQVDCQAVSKSCHALEAGGELIRVTRPHGRVINHLPASVNGTQT